MKPLLISIAIVLFTALAVSADTGKVTVVGGKPHFQATESVTKHATVLSINKDKRVLKMRGEKGDTTVVTVKPDVKTFDQIKVGDRIKVTYTDELTISVADSGAHSTDLVHEKMRADAKAGEQPRMTATERTTYVAKITSINQETGVVTLTDPAGTELTVTAKKKENLALVKVGDLATFTMTHRMAASVVKEPPPAKKAAAKPTK